MTIFDVAELRRRVLAGEDLTPEEYAAVINARRAARRELGATKTAGAAASRVSVTDALSALDAILSGGKS